MDHRTYFLFIPVIVFSLLIDSADTHLQAESRNDLIIDRTSNGSVPDRSGPLMLASRSRSDISPTVEAQQDADKEPATPLEGSGWRFYAGGSDRIKPVASVTHNSNGVETVSVALPAMAEGEYYYSTLSKFFPAIPDSIYTLSVRATSNIATSKDVIKLSDGERVAAVAIKSGTHEYKLRLESSNSVESIEVSLLAANAAGSRSDLDIVFSNINLAVDLAVAGWKFTAGASKRVTPVVAVEKDATGAEIVTARLPEMYEGEYYYTALTQNFPVMPDTTYVLSVTADSSISTAKDVIRMTDGVNAVANSLKHGIHRYKLRFKTSSDADNLNVDLLAANSTGSRGSLVVSFSDISFEDVNLRRAKTRNGTREFPESYAEYLGRIRRDYGGALRTTPADWDRSDIVYEWKDDNQRVEFSLDDLGPPEKDHTSRIVEATPILRSMPFPFYSSLSIPSDSCGSYFTDIFYMHNLLRRYGLNLTSSFMPFATSNDASSYGWLFNVFSPSSKFTPHSRKMEIEGSQIDAFRLFLFYYYRGWVDHIHNWSNEGSNFLTLLLPETLILADGEEGQRDLIPTRAKGGELWEGILFDLSVSEGIQDFEIRLNDLSGGSHFIVYNRALSGRAGWDISHLPRSSLGHLYVSFDEESGVAQKGALGEPGPEGRAMAGATLTAIAKGGGEIAVNSARPVDITSGEIARQLDFLGDYNVLPTLQSLHGGNSSWTNIRKQTPLTHNLTGIDGSNRTLTDSRHPYGSEKTSPTYLLDIYKRNGIIFSAQTIWPYTRENIERHGDSILGGPMRIIEFGHDEAFYEFRSSLIPNFITDADEKFPFASSSVEYCENLGANIAHFASNKNQFGIHKTMYMHFNFFSAEAVKGEDTAVQTHQMKSLPPSVIAGLKILSNAKYNLDGERLPHQRIWAAPASVIARFRQVQSQLSGNLERANNTIRIHPWIDPVTGKSMPETGYLTQDLHGQTFYVPNSRTAQVFVDEVEITALKRNEADFTGRESITIVDQHRPTLIFDELDLYEGNGRMVPNGAAYFFRNGNAYRGDYALEITSEKGGAVDVAWKPFLLDSHETDYLHFAYRKSNPKSRIRLGWGSREEGIEFLATEATLSSEQGWEIPYFEDNEYHEVILDFADMAGSDKHVPQGEILNIVFGLEDSEEGDSAFFDRVEFLAAGGARPSTDNTFVVGGRLTSETDGVEVIMRIAGEQRSTKTTRGGWYEFVDIPKGAVAKIYAIKAGVNYPPARGRLAQIEKNDIEYDIWDVDPRSPSLPRPIGYIGQEIPSFMRPQSTNSKKAKRQHDAPFKPHTNRFYAGLPGNKASYMVEDYVNNFGFIDKDRRVENPDRALRILIQGECWTEGQQTPANEHINLLLESELRRRTGLPVEVMVTAVSSSSPASWSLTYEKYGSAFNPDLVLLFFNPNNMAHLEPTVLKKLIGWDKEHSPYTMFDFDESGTLIEYPPDSSYWAHAVAPEPSPIVENVPLTTMYYLKQDAHPIIQRSFDLLSAILDSKYVQPMQESGASLGIITGYQKTSVPSTGTSYGEFTPIYQNWANSLNSVGQELGIDIIDLSDRLFATDYPGQMLWEHDSHLTATANYRFAEALANEILRLPKFSTLVESRAAKAETH